MTYKKYIEPVDLIVYSRLKEGDRWKALLDGVKPGSVTSSTHKLLRLGYIDSDYKVIKEINKTDISMRIGRGYFTVKEILNYIDKYGFSIIDNTQEKNTDSYEIDGVEKNGDLRVTVKEPNGGMYLSWYKEKQQLDREFKMHSIISSLWNYKNVIVNSKSNDEYEVTYEDIYKIAESIIDDIQGDSFEAILEYIDKYLEKNKYFDLA